MQGPSRPVRLAPIPSAPALPGADGSGIISAMSHLYRHCAASARLSSLGLFFVGLSTLGLLSAGCGQKGDLYLAEDDPARAERDARGRIKTFPFPDTSKPWPPAQSPTTDSASATPPEPARPADASP